MKTYYLLAFTLLSLIACKDDDDSSSPYPIFYTPNGVDQSDEGLYLVSDNDVLIDLPVNTGLYGAWKDSLKMELRDAVSANLDLQEVEVVNDNTLNLHFVLQGHEFITPVPYTTVNGNIMLNDTLQNGGLTFDIATQQFVLCGVTPFALPGPNAINPFGPPYLQFNIGECFESYDNRDYAEEYNNTQPLEPLDTIGVVLTKFLFAKE